MTLALIALARSYDRDDQPVRVVVEPVIVQVRPVDAAKIIDLESRRRDFPLPSMARSDTRRRQESRGVASPQGARRPLNPVVARTPDREADR